MVNPILFSMTTILTKSLIDLESAIPFFFLTNQQIVLRGLRMLDDNIGFRNFNRFEDCTVI